VQTFVKAFNKKYDEDPDLFAALAYDTIYLVAEAIKVGGPTRDGVHAALPQLKDVPSVVYKTVTFDPETRRAQNPTFETLVVKEGEFVPVEADEKAE
jgi:branched-chain amino acid transport system substrate-binding protein